MSAARLTPRQRAAVASVVGLAFLLRLIYSFEARDNPYFEQPIMDPLYHLEWARAFAAGEVFREGPFFRAPLYPWFLGLLLKVFGDGLLAPRIVQAGLGALTTGLTFAIGRRAFDFRVGLAAALLVAVNWVLIYFDGELLIPTLAIPLNLGALHVSLGLAQDPSRKRATVAGLLWGVAALARPNVLLFLPLLFGWLLLRRDAEGRRPWASALCLTLGALAPILPITAYNRIAGQDWVLVSSQAGVNLWIGNNPQSDGSTAIVPGTRPGWWDGFFDSIALAEESEGRRLKPSEVSAHYSGKARDWLLEEPGAALGHLLWKFRLFWTDWELGNNADVRFFAFRFSGLLRWLPPSFGLLGPLAVVGLWLALRGGRRQFPLWAFTLTYVFSVVLFFVCARYRAPVLPLFAVLGAAALVAGFESLRARRWGALGAGALVFGGVAVGVQQLPQGLDTTGAKGLWALGIHALGEEQSRQAQALLREAIEENPTFWIARKDLGLALVQAGELLEASDAFREALQIKPDDAQASASLVDVLLARTLVSEAEVEARRGLRMNPDLAQAHDALARVHVARQEWDSARGVLRAGLAKSPADFACNFRLGGIELQTGDPCAAVEPFERCLQGRIPNEALRGTLLQALEAARQGCRP